MRNLLTNVAERLGWSKGRACPARPARRAPLRLEALEGRELPAASVWLNVWQSTVYVQGTDNKDSIAIGPSSSSSGSIFTSPQVRITVAEKDTGTILAQGSYYSWAFNRVQVSALGGIDEVGNATSKTMVAYGGNDTDYLYGGSGTDYLYGQGGIDILYGGNGNDYLYGGDNANNELHGGSGRDQLYGGNRTDYLYGDADRDYLDGRDGNDFLYGSDGQGGSGETDDLYGGRGQDELHGEGGNDFLFGGADNDTLYGDLGDDYLWGDDSSGLEIGDDELYGGMGLDVLQGGRGNDRLEGGADKTTDRLIGGSGRDTFVRYEYLKCNVTSTPYGGYEDCYVSGEESEDESDFRFRSDRREVVEIET